MSGYSYEGFWSAVRALPRSRVGRTGCFVCDEVLPVAPQGRPVEAERRRCVQISGGRMDAHHCAIPKQALKREFPRGVQAPAAEGPWSRTPMPGRGRPLLPAARSLDDLLMDPRNGVMLRRHHHDAVEGRQIVIPEALMPEDMLEFVEELGLGWYLTKMQRRT